MILGTDHSKWDWVGVDGLTGGYYYVPINFVASEAVYVFLKACDGAADVPFYKESMRDARAAGKYAAPYVWLYPSWTISVKEQAEFWYWRLSDENLIAIDFESYSNFYPKASDLYGAIERLREIGFTGRIVIYTGHWYWLANGNDDSYWLQFPVWLARYSSNPPEPTPPWTREIIWQFSAVGDPAKYGVTNGKKAVDENLFYGTETELQDLFGGAVTPPPPNGGTMFQGTCIAASLYVRNAPVTGAIVGGLKLNDVVEADRIENGWWHLTKIRGAAPVGENWSYEGATKNYIRTDATPPPPPTEGVTVDFIVDGVIISSKLAPSGSKVTVTLTE